MSRSAGSPFVVAALIGLCAASPALARLSHTTWTTYLRSGPGTQFPVTDQIDTSATLDVGECRDGWCMVRSNDAEGYVRAELIAAPDASQAAMPPLTSCFDTRRSGFPRKGVATQYCTQ